MGKQESPLGDLKDDVKLLIADCRDLLLRVAVIENELNHLKSSGVARWQFWTAVTVALIATAAAFFKK